MDENKLSKEKLEDLESEDSKLENDRFQEFREILPVSIDSVTDSDEVSEENKLEILKFLQDCTAEGLSQKRIKKYKSNLKSILRFVAWDGFKLDGASQKDLKKLVSKINNHDRYSDWSKNDFRVCLNKYYKFKNDGKKPEKLEFMSTTKKRSNDKLPEDLLSRDEIDEMVQAARNSRGKAMISVLYESGCRIGEFVNLKIKHVQFDQKGYTIRVNGKTGTRRIRLIESERRMKNWLEDHPDSKNLEAYVWIGLGGGRKNKQLHPNTMRKLIRRIAKRGEVPLDKVNPHNFRHSRATELANKLTEAQMCEYFGWVQGSDQPATYVHLSGRDLDGAILKMHGMEDEEEKKKEEPRDCPRCGKQNSPRSKFCSRCSAPLDEQSMMKVQKAEEITDRTMEARLERMEQEIQKLRGS